MRWEVERFANAEGDKTGFQPGPLKGAIMREKSHPIPNTPPRTPHYTNHAMYIDEYREILKWRRIGMNVCFSVLRFLQ